MAAEYIRKLIYGSNLDNSFFKSERAEGPRGIEALCAVVFTCTESWASPHGAVTPAEPVV